MTGKKLTLDTIMLRTKCDKINAIKSLNLWGNDLEDISCVSQVHNLEIVSLTVNKIKTLEPFAYLSNLRELYMRNNKISNLSEVEHLINNKCLKSLSLNENPICDSNKYRLSVIKILPQLIKLDGVVISNEEKILSQNFDIDDGTSIHKYNSNEEKISNDNEIINNKITNRNNNNNSNDFVKKDLKREDTYTSSNSRFCYTNNYDERPIGGKKVKNTIKNDANMENDIDQNSNLINNYSESALNNEKHYLINRNEEINDSICTANNSNNIMKDKENIKIFKNSKSNVNKGCNKDQNTNFDITFKKDNNFKKLKSSQVINNSLAMSKDPYNLQNKEDYFQYNNNYNSKKDIDSCSIRNLKKSQNQSYNNKISDNSDDSSIYENNMNTKNAINKIKNKINKKKANNKFEPDNKNIINAINLLINDVSVRDMIIIRDIIDSKIHNYGKGNRYKYIEIEDGEEY